MNDNLIKELIGYDADSGKLFWKDSQLKKLHGKDVGSVDSYGYIQISVKRKRYKAHRVAWFLFYGVWPELALDHIDGDKKNNKISNLREASQVLNGWNNYKPQKNNAIGLRGVCKHRNKFMAYIKVSGKKMYLGLFDTAELAHFAYMQAKENFSPEQLKPI